MKSRYSTGLASILLLAGVTAMAIEEPAFTVVRRVGDIEIRQYQPYLVAETIVDGDFKAAGNEGFRRLFRYITGANRGQQKISMTAPVNQAAEPRKISMTAPVDQSRTDGGWAVSFVVPAEYTQETVPQPTDARVRIRAVPGQVTAVLRYSGTWGEDRYEQRRDELLATLRKEGLEVIGEPRIARYDGPFTPWFMRRNEVIVPLSSATATTTPAVGAGRG